MTRTMLAATAVAIAIGCAGLWLHLAPAVLAPPPSCPGLLERLAIAGARIGRAAPLGFWLVRSNRIILVIALAIFACLGVAATGAWAIAAAASLAFAAQPAFAITMSAFDPLAVGVAGLTLLALLAREPEGESRRESKGSFGGAWLCLLLTAAIVPRTALPMAVIAGWQAAVASSDSTMRLRWLIAGAASVALFGIVALLIVSMPSPPPLSSLSSLSSLSIPTDPAIAASCLLPRLSPQGGLRTLSGLAGSAGPFACSLAALGAFSLRAGLTGRRALSRHGPMVAYVATSAALGETSGMSGISGISGIDRALAPLLVAFWMLTAFGLVEVVRACRRNAGGRLAAAALVILLPLVQIAGRSREPASAVAAAALGHDRMSVDGMRRALQVMPDRSAIVSEDAVTDLLLRALDGTWQRSGKALQMVSRRQEDVAAAVHDESGHDESVHVFAWPWAQRDLAYLGFRLVDAALPGVWGVSDVQPGGACHALVQAWEAIPDISRSPLLVLVALNAREEGAIAIYAGSDRPFNPRPIDWPAWTTRGFIVSSYALQGGDRVRLDHDAVEDGLAGDHPVLHKPHVVRLELWKMPGAPALSAVELGADTSTIAVAHATPAITLQLCPGFPHEVRPIALPR
jgi:hypothetical protein